MSMIKNCLQPYARRYYSSTVKSLPRHKALIIDKYGEPIDCLKLQTKEAEGVLPKSLGPKQILVQHIASTVNPADINVIQGVYGIKPALPTIVGNEGITRVLCTGPDVKHLKPGDMCLGVSMLGYWQSYSVQNSEDMFKIDNDLDVIAAAQLKVNPCTAYRMIQDYAGLRLGDVLIQNGANSAVGVYAIQLARHWGLKTINVIRDRPNKCDIINELKDFGADYVVTEEEVRNVEIMGPILKTLGKPKLFLNCVGGKNATNCLRVLDQGGSTVTYGFMSKQPLIVGAKSMFMDHKLNFFWMSRWYNERILDRREEIQKMLDELSDMFKSNILRPKSSRLIDFEERNQAFMGSNNTKYMFSICK